LALLLQILGILIGLSFFRTKILYNKILCRLNKTLYGDVPHSNSFFQANLFPANFNGRRHRLRSKIFYNPCFLFLKYHVIKNASKHTGHKFLTFRVMAKDPVLTHHNFG
jgi:hypothetical protein